MTVYIPCYFNNIQDRESNFYTCLQQYLKLGYKVVIYWMNKKEFVFKDERIRVIKGSQVNASIARNKLLKVFYNTKEDYAILSDDDTFLNNKIKYYNDCTSYTNDFKNGIIETESISSSLMLIKNFKKFYQLEPLFDESLEANQDLDFGIYLNSIGIKTYRKSTKDVSIYKGKSSMFNSNMNKINKKQKSLNYINNKYGKYN